MRNTKGIPMTRIAINGFGRIGRNTLRALLERDSDLEVVAINDLTAPETLAHLLQVRQLPRPPRPHRRGRRRRPRRRRPSHPRARRAGAGRTCPGPSSGSMSCSSPPDASPSAEAARAHLTAGAKRVLVSAPADGADVTLAYGVNTDAFDPDRHVIVSNASCTTNALAPLAKVLDDLAGIEHGFMTTVHAYTQEQNLQDGPHRDLRRARAAAVNIVPTTTGAAKAIGLVLPQLDGKLSGDSIRVPVPVGSIVELNTTVATRRHPRRGARRLPRRRRRAACAASSTTPTSRSSPATSPGSPASSIFDAALTRVDGRHIKVVAWYDNEWGFSNRVVDTLELLARA